MQTLRKPKLLKKPLTTHNSIPPGPGRKGLTVRVGPYYKEQLDEGDQFEMVYLPDGPQTTNTVLKIDCVPLQDVSRELLPDEIEPGAKNYDGLLLAMNSPAVRSWFPELVLPTTMVTYIHFREEGS